MYGEYLLGGTLHIPTPLKKNEGHLGALIIPKIWKNIDNAPVTTNQSYIPINPTENPIENPMKNHHESHIHIHIKVTIVHEVYIYIVHGAYKGVACRNRTSFIDESTVSAGHQLLQAALTADEGKQLVPNLRAGAW